jgi:hypothetical protein
VLYGTYNQTQSATHSSRRSPADGSAPLASVSGPESRVTRLPSRAACYHASGQSLIRPHWDNHRDAIGRSGSRPAWPLQRSEAAGCYLPLGQSCYTPWRFCYTRVRGMPYRRPATLRALKGRLSFRIGSEYAVRPYASPIRELLVVFPTVITFARRPFERSAGSNTPPGRKVATCSSRESRAIAGTLA